jgi:hypothetical protein
VSKLLLLGEIMVGYLIGGAVIVVVGAIGIYFLIRFLRGSIKLYIQNTSCNSGETIKGSFELLTKKTIVGNRLAVELIGDKITKTRKSDGKTDSQSFEIFRNGVTLENQKIYQAGYKEKFDFELQTPDSNQPSSMNSELVQTLGAAISLMSDRQVYIKWRVEARLDAEGVDLVDTEKVSINGFN